MSVALDCMISMFLKSVKKQHWASYHHFLLALWDRHRHAVWWWWCDPIITLYPCIGNWPAKLGVSMPKANLLLTWLFSHRDWRLSSGLHWMCGQLCVCAEREWRTSEFSYTEIHMYFPFIFSTCTRGIMYVFVKCYYYSMQITLV